MRAGDLARAAALVLALAIAAGACTNGTQPSGEDEEIVPGGTLRLNMLSEVTARFDPQREWSAAAWELYRCCLLRTLLTYPGLPAAEGGGELVPDLAAALPTVSHDGLRWTFTLKRGVRYAPPFEATEIVAQDFVRAMEREADPETAAGGYGFFYSVIDGWGEFSEGEARRISGIRAPDDHTLRIRLTEPTGHFGFLMAMAATAPIPEGAADGHPEDYGRFLVASGPYMFEGSGDLDFSLPPKDQKPVAGYRPGKSIRLVRNPSWDLDDIRPANVDRISIAIGGTIEDAVRLVDAGDLDMQFDASAPPVQVRKYLADPQLQDEVFIDQTDTLRYLTMNLAAPPFDDVHVRRAVNLAVDKAGLRRILGGPTRGDIAGHIFPDGLTGGLLADYDPYATSRDRGDLERAMAEMALSAYDENGDGVCDARACRGIPTVTDGAAPYRAQAALIAENLEPLGLQLDVETLDRGAMLEKVLDPASETALSLGLVWGRDYVDGSTFGEPLFGSASIATDDACCNTSLVGATPAQLEELGYEPTQVPSVDGDIRACDLTPAGATRLRCWAELDRRLMEEVVPFVPYLFDTYERTVSDRVVNYTFDQFPGLPALDHIALAGGGEEG